MIRSKACVVTQNPGGTRMPSIRESSPRVSALAANDGDLRLVDFVEPQDIALLRHAEDCAA